MSAQPKECCGLRYDVCRIEIFDSMISKGQLVYNAALGLVELGPAGVDRRGYALPAHRPRKSLLKNPGYVAWRKRLGLEACERGCE